MLIIASFKGFSQKTHGIYNYHFDSGGDVINYNVLRLHLKGDMTFKLYEINRNSSGDTILVSLGKYYKNKDTISFVSPIPHNEHVLFYPYARRTIKKESLRISFNQKGSDNFYANVNGLTFFSINSINERVKIIPYDTVPSIKNFNNLMTYKDLDIYFSYFLKLPKKSKYLMICSDKARSNAALKGCITLDLSKLRINDIAMRKE